MFSYLNPILQFGLQKFCSAAADAGIDGALVTDLPLEEAVEYLRAMKAHKLAPVFLAAPTSTEQRLRAIAKHSRGFVYAISRTGITGTRQELAGDARSLVERLRAYTNCRSQSALVSRRQSSSLRLAASRMRPWSAVQSYRRSNKTRDRKLRLCQILASSPEQRNPLRPEVRLPQSPTKRRIEHGYRGLAQED